MTSLAENYSGVVVNQNQPPAAGDDFIDLSDGLWRFQEVFLPTDYPRGEEQLTPPLSGWQLFTGITDAENTIIEWKLQYDLFGSGWLDLSSGSTTGAQATGPKVWFDMLFDTPVPVSQDILDSRLRFGFRAAAGAPLAWYSAPNPLALAGFVKAYEADGTTAIQDSGNDVSMCFRVLGLVGDEGTDFLGNRYRSALVTVDGSGSTAWMSKPNPSRFAVESRFFDIRPRQDTPTYISDVPQPLTINDDVTVVDAILVDPTTPGIYFNVYYSNEGVPGTTEDEWNNKLWIRVPQTFRAVKRESHVLPSPILAKYIKLEFTHLQAKYYAPGDFAKPIRYRKHPKWVLDYFLARLTSERATETRLGGTVAVVYDALDLAYNYYLDDLAQEPNAPVEIDPSYTTNVTQFLSQSSDVSDQVDPTMLSKINLALAPYAQHPANFSTSDYLLGNYARQIAPLADYPTEASASTITYPDVQELRNEAVVFENDYPVMFFYLTCRHAYREVVAEFSHDRAYFAGVQEVLFTRERYASAVDLDQYIEPAGDLLNIERNDFVTVEGTMVVE